MIKNFAELQRCAERNTGKLTGAQEFLNYLHGFVNMLGPDRVTHGNEADRLYSIRRAVILRALLKAIEPKLKTGEEISIDESVLNGLLLATTYRQGMYPRDLVLFSRLFYSPTQLPENRKRCVIG